MTDPQKHLYFRRWNAVARANDWRMVRGRLACDAAANRERSKWHELVWRAADQLALAKVCAVNLEILRHACHRVASGWYEGDVFMLGAGFSTRKAVRPLWFDRLLGLWGNERGGRDWLAGLLIDPTHMSSVDWFVNAELRGKHRRQAYKVREAGGYAEAIVEDQFPRSQVDPRVADGLQPARSPLSPHQLECLVRTLSEREREREERAREARVWEAAQAREDVEITGPAEASLESEDVPF